MSSGSPENMRDVHTSDEHTSDGHMRYVLIAGTVVTPRSAQNAS